MSISCSDCGRSFESYERWTVVAEAGYTIARLCHACFDKHISGLVMPWDRVPPETPTTWPEVWRRYRLALGARSAGYGDDAEGEIMKRDRLGESFSRPSNKIRHVKFCMTNPAWGKHISINRSWIA
jgi:hypothetical protein